MTKRANQPDVMNYAAVVMTPKRRPVQEKRLKDPLVQIRDADHLREILFLKSPLMREIRKTSRIGGKWNQPWPKVWAKVRFVLLVNQHRADSASEKDRNEVWAKQEAQRAWHEGRASAGHPPVTLV